MALPKTRDVGKLRRFIRKEHPEWSEKQQIAVSLEQARQSGADIPRRRAKPKRKPR